MSDIGLITTAGRSLRAALLRGESKAGLMWYAVGSGDWADQDNPPIEQASATTLRGEIARKQIQRSAYLVLDAAGTIIYNNQTYSEVAGPTPFVAYYCDFLETEVVGADICEEAIFNGDALVNTSPFALAADVITPGILYWVRNRKKYSKATRDTLGLIAIFEEQGQ